MTVDHRATLALFVAGLGWGTTGIFVRLLGTKGLSSYEMLFARLIIAGLVLLPVFAVYRWREKRTPSPDVRNLVFFGISMALYYLGAITAFLYLPVVVAALTIGSSPVLAWILDIKDRKRPAVESAAGLGVGLATVGLLLLGLDHFLTKDITGGTGHLGFSVLGFISAVAAAAITVINARRLKNLGSKAPNPLQISLVTVGIGCIASSFLVSDFGGILNSVTDNLGLAIGFGVLATALPGLAIAYASVRLKPQATSTVSIQLQVWTGIFGWIFLNERLSVLQVCAAVLAIGGSWLCTQSKA